MSDECYKDERGWSFDRCIPEKGGQWSITDDGIYFHKATKNGVVSEKIGGQPIYISARTADLDTGSESVTVVWKDQSQVRQYTCPRKKLSTSSGVLELADQGYAVNSGNSRYIVNYLAHLLDYQKDNIPIRHLVSSCGTKVLDRTKIFMVGNDTLCGNGECPGILFNAQVDVDGIVHNLSSHEDGDLAEWVDIAREIGKYPMVAFGVAASFLPPLLKDLDIGQNPIIDYGGQSSTGKTTTLKLCASVWGYPLESDRGLVRTWAGSEVFFERYSAILNELPIFLDESHRANRKEACNILYQYANGTGRGRGSSRGIQQSSRYRGILFSAGEARLTDVGKTSGVLARVIGFWDSPFGNGERELVQRVNYVSEKHYGLAGKKVLQRYLRQREKLMPLYKEAHKRVSDDLAALVDDSIGKRLANYFGAVYIAGYLANAVLGLEWDVKQIVKEAFRLAVEKRPPNIAQESIELVGDWISSNRAKLDGSNIASAHGEPHGRIFFEKESGEERIGILPTTLQDLLEEQGYPFKSVLEQWTENGWLDNDTGRHKKKVRFNGGSTYMVVLNRVGIAAAHGGSDSYCSDNEVEQSEQ